MIGGADNDTYVVDNTGDVVTENASEGTDTVQSSITYTLGANIENLTLTGSTAINGTGNALDNTIAGNSAINTLTATTPWTVEQARISCLVVQVMTHTSWTIPVMS